MSRRPRRPMNPVLRAVSEQASLELQPDWRPIWAAACDFAVERIVQGGGLISSITTVDLVDEHFADRRDALVVEMTREGEDVLAVLQRLESSGQLSRELHCTIEEAVNAGAVVQGEVAYVMGLATGILMAAAITGTLAEDLKARSRLNTPTTPTEATLDGAINRVGSPAFLRAQQKLKLRHVEKGAGAARKESA